MSDHPLGGFRRRSITLAELARLAGSEPVQEDILRWLNDPRTSEAVFDERDRIANTPFRTEHGSLLPGHVYTIKTDNGVTQRTHQNVLIGRFEGFAGPTLPLPATKNGTRVEIIPRHITSVTLTSRPTRPISGG